MQKTIFVTGARGFIGKHLVNKILNSGYYIVCPPRNEIIKWLKDWNTSIDTIVHLAGNPSTKPVSDNEVLRTNVELTHDLILNSPKGCQFIFASTILVYGNSNKRFLETDPCSPTSVYAATKLASEALVNVYTNQRRIRGINLRMSATVGSGMNHGALPELVNKVLNNGYVEAFGKYPGSVKPYTHINDVISAILYAIKSELTGTYNACVSDNCSIADILSSILELTRLEKPIIWNDDAVWTGDNPLIEVDNWKLRKLGWKPRFPDSKMAIRQAIVDILNDTQRPLYEAKPL